MNFRMLTTEILDLLYPESLYCICCGKIIDASRNYRLCNECMEEIRWARGRTCRKCGKLLSENNPLDLCYSCREHSHAFDMGFTACEYGRNPRSIVFAMKYHGRADIAKTLGEILHDRMESVRRETGLIYDAVIPVPMYLPKQKGRGYNQAEVMARRFAELEGADYFPEGLIRGKNTVPLKGLAPDERRGAIAGIMRVEDPGAVHGKDILLIDDIYTTGATVDGASEALLKAGAERVYVLTFAAGADVIKSE